MPSEQQPKASRFAKRLSDLTPPTPFGSTPPERFAYDFQRLNHFFWSTEIAYAAVLDQYVTHEDGVGGAAATAAEMEAIS